MVRGCRIGQLKCAAALLLLSQSLGATVVPRLTFEQLTDAADLIVSGKVTGSWSAWDSEHKYIWTHYRITVTSAVKGAATPTLEFTEPGGYLAGRSMTIAGSVSYRVGESVLIFLSRLPNGYLRTTGWAQGKYGLDANEKLHATTLIGPEVVEAGTPPAGSSLTRLNDMSLGELKVRVAARLAAATPRSAR